ncbi:hypothetical protein [Amycolatopsis sp. lyj-108]|uniref:hypothetical protein n=1 Tax=Amycolatopsis sp. lyj-108 TaxID=2789286 RepID=UPI00397B0BAA
MRQQIEELGSANNSKRVAQQDPPQPIIDTCRNDPRADGGKGHVFHSTMHYFLPPTCGADAGTGSDGSSDTSMIPTAHMSRQRLGTVGGDAFLDIEDEPSMINDVISRSLLTEPGSYATVTS